jgi:2-oxoglutarate ferredoxin oxidoreductase subunit alpha
VEVDADEGATIGVLAYGATARPAMGAVKLARSAGEKVAFIRPKTIWPFPRKQIACAAAGLTRLLVPEMNLGQLCREVERHVDAEVVHLGKIGGVPHTSREIRLALSSAAGGEA